MAIARQVRTRIREVRLTPGKYGERVAIVDAADYERVSQHRWCCDKARNTFYARAWIGGRMVRLHTFLVSPPPGMMADHRNGDGLDNRRENLRVATASQNGANRHRTRGTSRYLGVCWSEQKQRWRALISDGTKRLAIGVFRSELEAAQAYDRKATEIHGEFARLNFPTEVVT